MPANTAEIVVMVRDMASRQFGQLQSATTAYENTLKRLNGTAASVSATLARIAGPAAVAMGFKQAVSTGFEFNSMMEDTRLGVASLLATTQNYYNKQGELIQGEQAWAAAMSQAVDIQQRLQYANLTTAATFDELMHAQQQAIVPATKAGFDIDQVNRFTVAVAQAASAMKIPMNQLGEEIRSILTGTMDPRNTRLMPLMTAAGLTNAKLKELAKTGQLFPSVMEAFASTTKGAEASADTFSTKLSNVKDAISFALGEASKSTFAGTKAVLDDIAGYFVNIDHEAKKVTVNPDFLASVQKIDNALTSTIGFIRDVSGAIRQFSADYPVISDIAKLLGSVGVGAIAAGMALRGMSAIFIFLKAVALANLAYLANIFATITAAVYAASAPLALVGAAIVAIGAAIAGSKLWDWIKTWEIAGKTIEEYVNIAEAWLSKLWAYIKFGFNDIGAFIKNVWAAVASSTKLAFLNIMAAIQDIPGVGQVIGVVHDFSASVKEAEAEQAKWYADLDAASRQNLANLNAELAAQDQVISQINQTADARRKAAEEQAKKDSTSKPKPMPDTSKPGKGKGPLDLADIDQQVDRFNDKIRSMYKELGDLNYDFWIEQARNAGDFYKAEELESDRWVKNQVDAVNEQVREAERALRELQQKVDKAGPRATAEALQAVAEAAAKKVEIEKIASDKINQIRDIDAEKDKKRLDDRQVSTQLSLASIAREYAQISGTHVQQYQAESAYLAAELQERLSKVQKFGEEWYALNALYAEKIRQANEKAYGSAMDGFISRLRQLGREADTSFEMGEKAADSFMSHVDTAFDDLFNGTKKLSDIWKEFLSGWLADIGKMMFKASMTNIMGSLLGKGQQPGAGALPGTGGSQPGQTGGGFLDSIKSMFGGGSSAGGMLGNAGTMNVTAGVVNVTGGAGAGTAAGLFGGAGGGTNAQTSQNPLSQGGAGGMGDMFKQLTDTMKGVMSSIMDMITSIISSITEIIGTIMKSIGDLLGSIMKGIGGMMGGGGGGMWGSIFGAIGGAGGGGMAGSYHGGGMAGYASTYRMVDPAIFRLAPRLHTGLAPDEFPAILQSGEEVTSRRDRSSIHSEIQSLRRSMSNSGQQPLRVTIKSNDPNTQVKFHPSGSQQAVSLRRAVSRGERML